MKLNPHFAECYLKKSDVLKSLNELEESKVYFEKAKELDPYLIIRESLKQKLNDDKAISSFLFFSSLLLFYLLLISLFYFLFQRIHLNVESKNNEICGIIVDDDKIK